MLPALFLPGPGLSGPVGFPPLSPLRLLLLFQFNSRPTVSVYHLLDRLRVSGFLSSPARGELGELLLHETGPEPGQVRVVVGVLKVEVVLVLLDGGQFLLCRLAEYVEPVRGGGGEFPLGGRRLRRVGPCCGYCLPVLLRSSGVEVVLVQPGAGQEVVDRFLDGRGVLRVFLQPLPDDSDCAGAPDQGGGAEQAGRLVGPGDPVAQGDAQVCCGFLGRWWGDDSWPMSSER